MYDFKKNFFVTFSSKWKWKEMDWYTFQNSLILHNKNEGSSRDVLFVHVVMSRCYVFKHCSKLVVAPVIN